MQNIGILLRPRHAIAMARAATRGLGANQPAEATGNNDSDAYTVQTNRESVDTLSVARSSEPAPEESGERQPTDGGSLEAAPVVEAQPVSKGILGTIINLMGGKKGKTPKQKKRKNAKRSLKKMKRKSRSSR